MKKILNLCLIMIFTIFVLCSCNKPDDSGNSQVAVYELTLEYLHNVEIEKVEVENEFTLPIKEEAGYVFIGWFDKDGIEYESIIVKENKSFKALYIKEGTTYSITYDPGKGSMPDEYISEYIIGEETNLPRPNSFGNMEFLGWYLNDELVESISSKTYGDLELVAKWNDYNTYYNIEYNLDGGEFTEEVITTYIDGTNYTLPIPKKEGYLFKGWYLEETFETRIKKITKETNKDYLLFAKFVERTRENIYISFLGDSITTYEGYIPSGFPTYYPTQGCDVDSVEKTWWHQVVTKSQSNLLVNNSCSGSLVTSGSNYANSMDRIKLLEKDGIDPDIVVIFMGTNDFTRSVNVTKFKTAYSQMIDKIKEEYDDVEIFIINLPYNKYGPSFVSIREKYNVALEEISIEKNVELIDLTEVITKANVDSMMFAGAHPSYLGMCTIANLVWKRIL